MTIEQRMDNIENQLRQMRSGFGDFAGWNGLGYPVAYSPQLTATVTNPVIGNGIANGLYVLNGRICTAIVYIRFGSTSTYGAGNYRISLPFSSSGRVLNFYGFCLLSDSSAATWYPHFCIVGANNTNLMYFARCDTPATTLSLTPTTPFAFAQNDDIQIQTTYEIA